MAAEVTEMVGPGLALIAAEPLAGVEVERVDAVLRAELEALADGLLPAELERARRLLLSDWVFALERIHQQALLIGGALARFRLDSALGFLRRVESATVEEVAAAAGRYLAPRWPAVVAWSLPAR